MAGKTDGSTREVRRKSDNKLKSIIINELQEAAKTETDPKSLLDMMKLLKVYYDDLDKHDKRDKQAAETQRKDQKLMIHR